MTESINQMPTYQDLHRTTVLGDNDGRAHPLIRIQDSREPKSQFLEVIKPSLSEVVYGPNSTVAGYRSMETKERTASWATMRKGVTVAVHRRHERHNSVTAGEHVP
jgi:hypothetical protein